MQHGLLVARVLARLRLECSALRDARQAFADQALAQRGALGQRPLAQACVDLRHGGVGEHALPRQPLGTHVYTAMEVTDDGAGMRWNLFTIPTDPNRQAEHQEGRRKGRSKAKEPPKPRPAVETRHPSNATEALNRIQMPKEAVDLIEELLSPGSSLIISDEGLGRETGRYTEFIVLTR